MTLIIGIRCTDGIVLGADGAATLGTTFQPTVVQPMRKLDIIRDSIIVGVSGPAGLGQLFKGEIDKLWQEQKLSGKKPFEAMSILREAMWKHAGPNWEATAVVSRTLGAQAAISASTGTIMALPVSKLHCLFQFDHQCSPEQATEDLPFASVGNAQWIADPFLAFLRRIFWKDKSPSLVDGIFATLWALDHAIVTNPGGVANPKQLVILEKLSRDWKARELQDAELQEHYQAIEEAEKSLANFRDKLRQPEDKIQLPQTGKS